MSFAAIAARRRRRNAVIVTDFTAVDLVWEDGPPTLNAFGATAYSRAVARNAAHQIIPQAHQPTITYSSLSTSVATVDSTGLVTAVANGTATIQAASTGLTSITQTATVSQTVASISGVSSTLSTDDASSGTFSPVGKDANNNTVAGATFAYAVDFASILSVNATSGAWAGQSAGTAHVTITASPGGATFVVTATVTHATAGSVTAVSPVYNGQQSPQGLLLFGGVSPESALSLVDQSSNPLSTSGVTWTSSDPTHCPIDSTTGVISPSSGITTQLLVTFTGTHTASGKSATVTANLLKGGWQGDVIAYDDMTDYAGNAATADAALLAHISSHANDINTSVNNSWDPTGTTRNPTGPANARYIQCVNANWLQADTAHPFMGRNTIRMWFPGGMGGSAQPQVVFGTNAANVTPARLHHLRLERFDSGFTTQGDLTIYNNPGTGSDGTAASYKNGPWDGFSNYTGEAATTITNSTQEQVAFLPAISGTNKVTSDWTGVGDVASFFTGANAGQWRLVYTLEETIDNRVRTRKWAVAAGTGTLTFLGESVGAYFDTIAMPSGVAKFHQSTILGANWNRTRAPLPGGTQALNRGPWYIVNGDTQSDPFGILAAAGEATPTLTSASVTSFNAGDTGITTVLTGTGFTKNCAVVFSDTNLRVQSVSYDSATQMTVVVNALSTLAAGSSTLLVKNTALGASSGTVAITATANPVLTSVSPTSIVQGTTGNVVLTGRNFTSAAAGQSVVFSNAGITINSTSFDSATQITVNVTVSAGATTGAGTVKIHDTAHTDSGTKNISVASASLNIPAGLSGLGFFAEDFTSYANDTALKNSSNVQFGQTGTSWGFLDTGTTYNSHATYKNRLETDGYQGAIQIKSTIYGDAAYLHTAATYRSTIKFPAGFSVPTGGNYDLSVVWPKDSTKYEISTASWLAKLQIKNVSGTLHYYVTVQLHNTGGGAVATLTYDCGAVGAEVTSGYTIDYFVRVTAIDATHFQVAVALAKNVSGTVSSAMWLMPATSVSSTVSDANRYHGNWQPTGWNHGQSIPSAEVDLWVSQLEAIDETTNPDWYGLVNATSYTPLT